MANAALFIGFGAPARGREQQSLQLFTDATQFYGRMQQQGEIESFEAVLLEPHGGDLGGFILVRGARDRLERIRYSEEFLRLNQRALLILEHFGVVGGFIGEGLTQQLTEYGAQLASLG